VISCTPVASFRARMRKPSDRIGVPLLDRIGHRSKLTTAGEIVYQRALRMLAERDDLMSELDELRSLGTPRFR